MLPSDEECDGVAAWFTDKTKGGHSFDPRTQFGIAERFCLATQQTVGSAQRLASKLRATRFKLEFDIVQDLVTDKMSLMAAALKVPQISRHLPPQLPVSLHPVHPSLTSFASSHAPATFLCSPLRPT